MSRVSATHTNFFLSSLCDFSSTDSGITHSTREKEVKYMKAKHSRALAKGKSTFCLYLSVQLLFTSRSVQSLKKNHPQVDSSGSLIKHQ